MRRQIEIAAKLYRCHDAAKKLFGEEFHKKIKGYKDLIEKVREKYDLGTFKAVIKICENEDDGMVLLLTMAAAVEILEPSNTPEV